MESSFRDFDRGHTLFWRLFEIYSDVRDLGRAEKAVLVTESSIPLNGKSLNLLSVGERNRLMERIETEVDQLRKDYPECGLVLPLFDEGRYSLSLQDDFEPWRIPNLKDPLVAEFSRLNGNVIISSDSLAGLLYAAGSYLGESTRGIILA